MRVAANLVAFTIGLTALAAAHADDAFRYATTVAANEVVIDSRPLADCKQATLPNARCLPADGFLGPHRRLPSERDILWLLGTAGLDGSETVLVVGQDATARDFVAGLLYLAGQRQVRVMTEPLARLAGSRVPGQERGIVRAAVYTAPMRDRLWLLKQDILVGAPVLLDGRGEAEYWGEVVRGARGGHLPGAILLPAMSLTSRPSLPADGAVAYAHDAYEGLAYFTRLVAGHGIAARVYPGGWAEWAADSRLPVDAASYPERRAEAPAVASPVPAAVSPAPTSGASRAVIALAAGAALLAAFAGGWMLSRRRMA